MAGGVEVVLVAVAFASSVGIGGLVDMVVFERAPRNVALSHIIGVGGDEVARVGTRTMISQHARACEDGCGLMAHVGESCRSRLWCLVEES